MPSSSTGSFVLPDIGTLAYNGVTFSSLYSSSVSGDVVKDNANRTTKYMKYTITVEGFVTLNDDVGDTTVDREWASILRVKLTQQAGQLTYTGKGFGNPFVVNKPGGTLFDVAWGPIPELLEFVPMGGSRSARIVWRVTTCIPELKHTQAFLPVLQFNEETTISYDTAGFSSISIRGTLEVPMTRPTQTTKTLTSTVDDFRLEYMARIASGFDLERFQVTRRDFDISRDKRTLEWNFRLDELPWMGLPGGMLEADGNVTMRPFRPPTDLRGTVQWLCTIRATYQVPNGKARRLAYLAFLAMWNFRMRFNEFGYTGVVNAGGVAVNNNPQVAVNQANLYAIGYGSKVIQAVDANPNPQNVFGVYNAAIRALPAPAPTTRAFPLHFSYDEGIYKGAKTISFEASWRFFSHISNILVASGLWRRTGLEGGDFWATSIRDISGGQSWLQNKLDPAGAAIVDFGT